MRKVVVLPHPDGPRSMKNSPSSTVKVEDLNRGEGSEVLAHIFDDDLAMNHSGNG
jgi:hypothetical protein